jgi:hypothetical protein
MDKCNGIGEWIQLITNILNYCGCSMIGTQAFAHNNFESKMRSHFPRTLY